MTWREVPTRAILALLVCKTADGRIADRSRVVKMRQQPGEKMHDNGRPIAGPAYRSRVAAEEWDASDRILADQQKKKNRKAAQPLKAPYKMETEQQPMDERNGDVNMLKEDQDPRKLSSYYSGCCSDYQSYDSASMCSLYGYDCESGETPSNDSSDGDCDHDGLSFIGISFSVNTASGSPYSYQLCDQFPMENIIDRDYDYIMSIDEDGWLVGGGYKTFDYSGKMPYIDSSHTELLRIGNLDPDTG